MNQTICDRRTTRHTRLTVWLVALAEIVISSPGGRRSCHDRMAPRKEHHMKRLTIVLAFALVGASTSAAAPARLSACCPTSHLVVWVDPTGDAAAGSTYVTLKFTNHSGHACTLTGYPGVSALDLRGRVLGSPASRDPSTKRTVHLANGATASATLRIAFAGNFPPSACRRRAAAGLRVYPPDQTAAKTVPIPFEACSRRGPVFLSVRAVTT
jgi:Domain of unknown function (DUF4232)